jgi:membrane-associated phospholipid phosphatase
VRHIPFAAAELLMLVAAIALAFAVRRHPGPLPGDVGLSLAAQHTLLPHRALTAEIDAVSTINWPIPSAIALAVVIVVLLFLRRKLDAIVALVTSGVADGSSYLTNQLVRRPRPMGHGLHVLQHITNYFSFPSGHVIHALAFFGFLVFLTYQTRRPAPWLWIVRVVLVALIVLMGPSRILEGEHWPSDVVEGLLYGALWLILGIHAFKWARQRWPRLLSHDEQQALIR